MIKKNTKVIFKGEPDKKLDAFQGGMPLSKGEILHIHENSEVTDYEVIDKKIDCILEGEDQIINIIYTLKKKK